MSRLLALVVASAILFVACAGTDDAAPVRSDVEGPSALEDMTQDGLPEPLIPPEEVISGGPPPDGIPSIDQPIFTNVSDADFLVDTEPVLVLEVDGAAKVYPVQIMIWHEIVNDEIAGVPVTVTYCPLCNSAIAYDRRVAGDILDFGTSGRLYQSALVMYDRQTESLWSHFSGEAFAGVLTGTDLVRFPLATVSWADARDTFPDGEVLTTDTGFDRRYGDNPYPGYDNVGTSPFLFRDEPDGRLAAKTRVIGVSGTDDSIAVKLDDVSSPGVLRTGFDGRQIVVFRTPGTNSALDTSQIPNGDDVGATGVFRPVVDGTSRTFLIRDGEIVDAETGSVWNVLGKSTGGPSAGAALEAVEHVDTFWFAWAAFETSTRIVP